MGPLLVVLFLVVPVVEIYLIVQVGQLIGPLPTALLLLGESLLGAWLVKREGRRAWRTLQVALGSLRPPGRELLDGALLLIGGTLLLTPGFLTDVLGFFLVLPVTRPLARRALLRLLSRRFLLLGLLQPPDRRPPRRAYEQQPPRKPPPPRAGPQVVPGEVVDPDQPPPR